MTTDRLAPLSSPTSMPADTATSQTLSEEQVIEGFHIFLQTALAQAKAERLLDADTLASAEADLMVSGSSWLVHFSPDGVSEPRHAKDLPCVHTELLWAQDTSLVCLWHILTQGLLCHVNFHLTSSCRSCPVPLFRRIKIYHGSTIGATSSWSRR